MILAAVLACVGVHAATQLLTFGQAVIKGTGLKGCPKRLHTTIESVYLSDPDGVRAGASAFLVFQGRGSENSPVIGPLALVPSQKQLDALVGRRMCATPD